MGVLASPSGGERGSGSPSVLAGNPLTASASPGPPEGVARLVARVSRGCARTRAWSRSAGEKPVPGPHGPPAQNGTGREESKPPVVRAKGSLPTPVGLDNKPGQLARASASTKKEPEPRSAVKRKSLRVNPPLLGKSELLGLAQNRRQRAAAPGHVKPREPSSAWANPPPDPPLDPHRSPSPAPNGGMGQVSEHCRLVETELCAPLLSFGEQPRVPSTMGGEQHLREFVRVGPASGVCGKPCDPRLVDFKAGPEASPDAGLEVGPQAGPKGGTFSELQELPSSPAAPPTRQPCAGDGVPRPRSRLCAG